jgi:hypothetical protein
MQVYRVLDVDITHHSLISIGERLSRSISIQDRNLPLKNSVETISLFHGKSLLLRPMPQQQAT